jgi:hypothetical protein
LDWHVFNNSFRISTGVLINKNKANLQANVELSYDIGNGTYTATETGTLNAAFDYDREIVPYIGIGFGNALNSKRRLGLMCDLGVVFTGSPQVALNAAGGTLTNNAGFQADIKREQDNIQKDLDELKIYPVLALSMFWRF